MKERLQKIIAARGLASRRDAEAWIREGLVLVNGRVADLGESADPEVDAIKVRGKLLGKPPTKRYVLVNKPANVITTREDPEGRPTIMSLLGERTDLRALYPVGRLDWESEGAVLLTNDGELTNKLLHPSSEIPRTYLIKVKTPLADKDLERLRRGVHLADGKTKPCEIERFQKPGAQRPWYTITLREGRQRQVRRMMEAVHNWVVVLRRVRFGPIELGRLPKGAWRELTAEEARDLRAAVGLGSASARAAAAAAAAKPEKPARKKGWAKPGPRRKMGPPGKAARGRPRER